MACLLKTIFKEEASTTGPMAENMTANGITIRWKVKAPSHGLTAEDMKEIMSTTRKKEMESFIGQMAGNTKEAGKTENNMELELIHQQAVRLSKVNGQKVKDFTGYPMTENNETLIHKIFDLFES